MATQGLTQAALAANLGVDRVQVGRYLTGDREPGQLACLLLAGLAENKDERNFWIIKSGVTHEQFVLLAKALGLSAPKVLSSEDHALLDWWRNPKNKMEENFKQAILQLLKVRS
jgi:transcriptional regulator with XRE-family HTH domain